MVILMKTMTLGSTGITVNRNGFGGRAGDTRYGEEGGARQPHAV